MKLFEYEGKQLLKSYGIPIPEGILLSNTSLEIIDYPKIAKVQVLSGGRGKLGGIKRVNDINEAKVTIDTLKNLIIHNETVEDIYLENLVSYKKELYVSIVIDRNLKMPVILVCNHGGVEIESIPSNEILRIPINPVIKLQSFMIKEIGYFTSIPLKEIEMLINSLYTLFLESKATLVEINPLFVSETDKLIAGDAKVVVEEDSIYEKRGIQLLSRDKDNFEDKCLKLGAVGVDLQEGKTAVITSGAGLGMASFDLLTHYKVDVRALVDLGGHVIHSAELAEQLINELKVLNIKEYFFNFYFQVASCKVLASSIANVLGNTESRVIVRMNGKDFNEAKESLSGFDNVTVISTMNEAKAIFEEKVG